LLEASGGNKGNRANSVAKADMLKLNPVLVWWMPKSFTFPPPDMDLPA